MITIPLAMTPETQRLIVLAVLGLLAIGMIGAAGVFVYSVWKQRKYNTTALPSLGGPEDEVDEEADDDEDSAFALDLVKAEPVSKGAFATRLDDEVDFTQFTPRDEPVEASTKAEPLPEVALPLPPGMTMTPLEPVPTHRPMALDGDEPDEFPPFQGSEEFLTPELKAASEPRRARDLDDDEELDFTPVLQRNDEVQPVQEFRRLHAPVDKIEPTFSSDSSSEEFIDGHYVGRRRRPGQTDQEAL